MSIKRKSFKNNTTIYCIFFITNKKYVFEFILVNNQGQHKNFELNIQVYSQ